MPSKKHEDVTNHIMTYESLIEAMRDAGADLKKLHIDYLQSLTAMELIEMISGWKVRFFASSECDIIYKQKLEYKGDEKNDSS